MKPTFFAIALFYLVLPAVWSEDSNCQSCTVDVDDADSRIIYTGDWTHQKNAPTVSGEQIYFKATNSFSPAAGAKASFKFTGSVRSIFLFPQSRSYSPRRGLSTGPFTATPSRLISMETLQRLTSVEALTQISSRPSVSTQLDHTQSPSRHSQPVQVAYIQASV